MRNYFGLPKSLASGVPQLSDMRSAGGISDASVKEHLPWSSIWPFGYSQSKKGSCLWLQHLTPRDRHYA
jgi:hypothetical protein